MRANEFIIETQELDEIERLAPDGFSSGNAGGAGDLWGESDDARVDGDWADQRRRVILPSRRRGSGRLVGHGYGIVDWNL